MNALKRDARNVYTLEGASAWIRAGNQSIWIVKGPGFITVNVFDDRTDEVIDSIHIKQLETAK